MKLSIATAAALALAASAKSTTGSLKAYVDNKVYDGKPTTSLINFDGLHVKLWVNPNNGALLNYTLTGNPDDLRLVNSSTIIMSSKTIDLTPSQLNRIKVDSFQLKDDSATLILKSDAGKIKFQINDGAQGGIFQIETEFATNVTFTHTLGPNLFYFKNPNTGKINFGDGYPAVSKQESATGYHNMLLVKDSPQVADKTLQTSKQTKWNVAPGGRLGMVFGTDAVEFSAGATLCTSQCQAQNRLQDSVAAPADPTGVKPL